MRDGRGMQRLNQQPQRVQITPLWSEYIYAAWNGHGTDSERAWRVRLRGKGRVTVEVGLGGVVGIRTRIISTTIC